MIKNEEKKHVSSSTMSMAIVALEPLPIPLCLGYLAMAARDHACPLVAKKASALVYNRFVNYYGNKSKKKNNAQELQEEDEVMDSDSETACQDEFLCAQVVWSGTNCYPMSEANDDNESPTYARFTDGVDCSVKAGWSLKTKRKK